MTGRGIDGLRLEVTDGVARVGLERPDVGNALTRPMVAHLADFFGEASGDRKIRVITIAAAGSKFCTGPDLRVSLDPGAPGAAEPRVLGVLARGMREYWQRLITAMLDCEKPILAAVNGDAAGAGMQLALAADLIIASEDARFIEVFVRRGLAPDAGAAYLLTRLVGMQQAKRLCFFGDAITAAEALRLGLVSEVVPGDQLSARTEELAMRLAVAPTAAVAAAKRLINHAPDVDRSTALWEEAQVQEAIVTGTADAQEGLNSFLERRRPRFVGH